MPYFLAVLATITLLASTIATALEHPAGAHCVSYQATGMGGKGDITRCTDGSDKSVEVRKVRVGLGPFGKREDKVVITLGATIFTVDHKKKQTLRTQNPMYQSLSEAHEDQQEAGAYWLQALGFVATVEQESVADESCKIYRSELLGTVCMTSDLIAVSQKNLGQNLVATKVERHTAGPTDHYDPTSFGYPITDAPDIGKILADLGQATGSAGTNTAPATQTGKDTSTKPVEGAATDSASENPLGQGSASGTLSQEVQQSAEDAVEDAITEDKSRPVAKEIKKGLNKLKGLLRKGD